MSRKKLLILLLLGGTLVLIFILLWVISIISRGQQGVGGNLVGAEFGVIATNPLLDRNVTHGPTTLVEFTFNKAPNPRRIHYTISPYINTILDTDVGKENTIGIVPEGLWSNGINIITITTETQAADGTFLKENFLYLLNIKPLNEYELGVEIGSTEQAVYKLIQEVLPYDGKNFSMEYDAHQNILNVYILQSKRQEGLAEFEAFLKKHGIENRTEVLNLQIHYI